MSNANYIMKSLPSQAENPLLSLKFNEELQENKLPAKVEAN